MGKTLLIVRKSVGQLYPRQSEKPFYIGIYAQLGLGGNLRQKNRHDKCCELGHDE
jgi:hypothetical protein